MLNIKKLLTKILGAFKVTQLSTTYTSNSYMTQTAFNRMIVRRYGALVVVTGNLSLDSGTSMPKSTAFTKVGSITLPSNLSSAIYVYLPCSDAGEVLVSIETNGAVQLYNYKTTAAKGWIRFSAIGILSGGVS